MLKGFFSKVLPQKQRIILQWNFSLNPLSANPTKWSNTLKQFVGKLPTNCFSVFDHFVKLALKGLRKVRAENLPLKKDMLSPTECWERYLLKPRLIPGLNWHESWILQLINVKYILKLIETFMKRRLSIKRGKV